MHHTKLNDGVSNNCLEGFKGQYIYLYVPYIYQRS